MALLDLADALSFGHIFTGWRPSLKLKEWRVDEAATAQG